MLLRNDHTYKKFNIGDLVVCDHETNEYDGTKGLLATVVGKYKHEPEGNAYYIKFEDGRQFARYSWSFSLAGKPYDPAQQPYEDSDI